MKLQFPDLDNIISNIFGPFFIFVFILTVMGIIIFIIILVFILKMLFGDDKKEEPPSISNSQSNPYAAKLKTHTEDKKVKAEKKDTQDPKVSICPYCGVNVEKNQKFCTGCGAALD